MENYIPIIYPTVLAEFVEAVGKGREVGLGWAEPGRTSLTLCVPDPRLTRPLELPPERGAQP